MAPRPKNPPPDRRADILEAALQVFSRRGYAGATNAEIAREAGVTAAALYYYFPGKEDLFKAVISERQAGIFPTFQQMGDQLREMPPQTVIPLVVQNLIRFFNDERTQTVMRIILAEGPRNPELAEIWQSKAIGPVAPFLLGYLQYQMDRGVIRRMDPRVLATILNGPVLMTIIVRDLLRLPLAQGVSNETLARDLAETLLHGLLVEEKTNEGSDPE